MEERHYQALELDKVLELLVQECASQLAAERARALCPTASLAEARERLAESWDAYSLMAQYGAPSFGALRDVRNPLRRAQAGASLTARELLRVAEVLRCLRAVRSWRDKSAGTSSILDRHFDSIQTNKYLEEKIFASIDEEEHINDNASPALATIRRKIRAASNRAREKLDEICRSQRYQKYLQEPIVTQRGGRYVVPVRAECRSEISGLVHDSSASGATVFVEPMAVVEANNQVRVLRGDEQAEIERILFALSAEAGAGADATVRSCHEAAELDLLFAKASLGYKMKATMPALNADGVTDLKAARHPLLARDTAVPIDLRLGSDFDTLVITGPNTGGKTVSLKTLGLLSLMAACGLLLPVADGSRVSVYANVLADIGDEQSIEQSLSTFSAHMCNIKEILQQADGSTLVLLDELGAGTDPVEGAALAQAILEQLRRQGARVAATTHYAELKLYALETPGVCNGSCEFDVQSLRPTYRLLIGVPGRSNAFAISQRLGIPAQVVARAQTLVSQEDTHFERAVGQLEENRLLLEREREAARAARAEAEQLRAQAADAQARVQRDAQRELDRAHEQAAMLVSRTRAQVEALQDELDALKKKQRPLSAEERARLRGDLRTLEDSADPVTPRNLPASSARPLRAGDTVQILGTNRQATVLSVDADGKHAMVQTGAIRTRSAVEDLRLVPEGEKQKEARRRSRAVTKQFAAAPAASELDLRGQTVGESLGQVDRFLDSARRAHLTQVTIIHGKGTGALRKAVQDYLRHHAAVESYRLGTYGEGESGVTVVEIRQ